MKKYISSLITVIAASMFMVGCGQSTPKGTDQVVKDTVIEIAQGEFRKQLTPAIYQKVTGIPVGIIGAKVTYEGLKAKASSDKDAKKTIEAIDTAMAKTKMSLQNIRISMIDDKTKMSRSSADLMVNKFKVPIEYTAQLNSDGQVYVEVYGLKF